MKLCFSCFFLSIQSFRLLWKLWNSSCMLPNSAAIYWMICIQTGFLKIPQLVTESVFTNCGQVDEMNFRGPSHPKLFYDSMFLQVYTQENQYFYKRRLPEWKIPVQRVTASRTTKHVLRQNHLEHWLSCSSCLLNIKVLFMWIRKRGEREKARS